MKLLLNNIDFEQEILEKVIDAFNTTSDKIEIYLNSKGGRHSILQVLLHIVNSDPQRFKIIGFHFIASCAFEFYIKAKCEKELLFATSGMFHLGYTYIEFNDKMKPAYQSDKEAVKKIKNIFYPEVNDFLELCEFSLVEKKKINAGEDVYFERERILELESNYKKNTN